MRELPEEGQGDDSGERELGVSSLGLKPEGSLRVLKAGARMEGPGAEAGCPSHKGDRGCESPEASLSPPNGHLKGFRKSGKHSSVPLWALRSGDSRMLQDWCKGL